MSDGLFGEVFPLNGYIHLFGSNQHGNFSGDGTFVRVFASSVPNAIDALLGIDGTSQTYDGRTWWQRVLRRPNG